MKRTTALASLSCLLLVASSYPRAEEAEAAVLCRRGSKIRLRTESCKPNEHAEQLDSTAVHLPELPSLPACGPSEALRWSGTEYGCVPPGALDCRAHTSFRTVLLDDNLEHEVTSANCPAGTEVAGGGFAPRSQLPDGFSWRSSVKVFNQPRWACGFAAHAPGETLEIGCQVICCTNGEWPEESTP